MKRDNIFSKHISLVYAPSGFSYLVGKDKNRVKGLYKKNWIDKLITHNRDTVGDYGSRLVLHIIPGFLMGLLPGFSGLFIRYEENEDLHTKDQAWKDYAGAMWGYVPGRLVLVASIAWLALKLLEVLGG